MSYLLASALNLYGPIMGEIYDRGRLLGKDNLELMGIIMII